MEALTEQIRSRIRHEPRVGIVCGSGLGGLADVVEDKQMIKYSELEGMPVSTGQWLTTQRGGGGSMKPRLCILTPRSGSLLIFHFEFVHSIGDIFNALFA